MCVHVLSDSRTTFMAFTCWPNNVSELNNIALLDLSAS